MRTSRRDLIRLGLCATASYFTFFEGLSGRIASAALATSDDGWLRRDIFEQRVNDSFVVHLQPSGSITLRLKRVEDVPTAQVAGTVNSDDCFQVVFSGPKGAQLAQNTYRVENGTIGSFELFLVPAPPTSTASTFVATFNRLAN